MTVKSVHRTLTEHSNGTCHVGTCEEAATVSGQYDGPEYGASSISSAQLTLEKQKQHFSLNAPRDPIIKPFDFSTKVGTPNGASRPTSQNTKFHSTACHGHRTSQMAANQGPTGLSADASRYEASSPNGEALFPLERPLRFTNLIFDLGDVFAFHDFKAVDTPIQPRKLKLMLNSPDWHMHESGKMSRGECFERLSRTFDICTDDLNAAFEQVAITLTYNQPLIKLVQELKAAAEGELKVYLLTNITEEDWEILRPPCQSWRIFDGIYTSFAARARKPDHKCFHHLFRETGIDPGASIFVDDKPENVLAAQCLGLHGILFDTTDSLIATLETMLGNPVARGEQWLRSHAQQMWCTSNTGVQIRDQFTQLLILDIMGDRSLVTLSDTPAKTFNTFIGKPVLTTETYPDDIDTTTLAFLNLSIPSEVKHEIMDEMREFMTEDGLFLTYFDATRPRLDPVVSSNVLRLFYSHNRGYEVASTLKYVYDIIRTRAYTVGARYYYHPDWYFFYLSNLVAKHSNSELDDLRNILRVRLKERMGCPAWSDACSAALRTISAQNLGLEDLKDLDILVRTQQADGSWGKDPWVYQYGSTKVLFGSAGLVTTMAVKALKTASPEMVTEAVKGFRARS